MSVGNLKLGLGTKVMIGFLVATLTSILLVSWMSYQAANQALEEEAFNKLVAVREIKATQIEDYFSNIRRQVQTFSESRTVVNAMLGLKRGFHNIESDLKIDSRKLSSMDGSLRKYYNSKFLPRLSKNLGSDASISSYWPNDVKTRVLQDIYMASNRNETGSKHLLDAADDGSPYSRTHQQYHPIIRNFLEEFGYYDIFLIDHQTGHVVYSVFKEVDYGTSLNNGPYRNSNLADVFRAARDAGQTSFVKLEDFKPYHPSYSAPASFIASPIFENGEKIGVLVFQMPVDKINDIMTSKSRWADVGLGASGETYIVANDFKLRSQSRFLLDDAEGYFQALKENGFSSDVISKIQLLGTAIGLQEVKTRASEQALNGKTSREIIQDYRDVAVLSAYRPLDIGDMHWSMMSEIDEAEAFAPVYQLRNTIIIISLIILSVVAAIAVVFSRVMITRPLTDALRRTRDVAEGEGDLTKRIPVNSTDEIGQLSAAINQFIEKIHDTVAQLKQGMSAINNASAQISSTSQSLSQGASEQAASVEETSASLEQMSATITQNADNANVTSNMAQQTSGQAVEGGEAVDKTVSAMSEIAGKIGIIEDIAYKTNLLALNAAIEAARAGEHGKGFAVVADEVRKLAERSQISAQEISELSNNSVEVAQRAGALLKEIVPGIEKTADLVQEISAASDEQKAGVGQVNAAIGQLDQVAQQNAASSEELAATSEEMDSQVNELFDLVNFFKVNDDLESSSSSTGSSFSSKAEPVIIPDHKQA